MTTKANEAHQKHAAIVRPALGDFGRNELGILGAPCSVIREHANSWIKLLGGQYNLAYVDADHHATVEEPGIIGEASVQFTDKISFKRLDIRGEINFFKNRSLFNDQDLILINGNHFKAKKQIAIIHPDKPLDKKLDKLNDVQLILLTEHAVVPEYLAAHLSGNNDIPVLQLTNEQGISAFIKAFLKQSIPPLNGLVLAGGKSTRMQTDKGSIVYHGESQRNYAFNLLSGLCTKVFISGSGNEGLPEIGDTFIGLGPYGGILSAMQLNPDTAWLTIACDLPYLTADTLQYLVKHRNPSKLATAFLDSDDKFPEPLITIWEPRAYPVMLQFLSQGYSCPRKVLINTDIELLNAPDVSEFRNVNHPQERDEALRHFGNQI